MKALYIILSVLAGSSALTCLSVPALAQKPFKSLRYDEQYEYLKDSSKLDWYDKMKFTRLGSTGKNYLSLGGEVRYQYFRFVNEDWGDAPPDNDGFVLSRFLMHGDLHITNRFRTFVQLQSSIASGRMEPTSLEQNELDVHQAFFDFALLANKKNSLVLRAGRQEFTFGSSRLVSPREGPNNRQAFDAVKVILTRTNLKAEAFVSDFVVSKKGIFNDQFLNKAVKFWGAYVVRKNIPVIQNMDLYYFGAERAKTTWSDVTGKELRHSFGSRIWGSTHRWNYDFEGVYQFGDMEGNTISAGTLSSNVNVMLSDSELTPLVGLKTEFISGDHKSEDGKIQSFNPLFPRGAYFGYAALIGPSNLLDIHPSFTLPISRSFATTIDYDIFWRFSTKDGIYGPGANVIYPAGDSNEKFIGHQVSGNIEYTGNRHIFIRAEITWFKSGPYMKSVSAGKNILFTGLTTTLKF